MAVVKADLTRCEGYANCVSAAPDVFDVNDQGVVTILRLDITAADRARVEEAVRSCPESALLIED